MMPARGFPSGMYGQAGMFGGQMMRGPRGFMPRGMSRGMPVGGPQGRFAPLL